MSCFSRGLKQQCGGDGVNSALSFCGLVLRPLICYANTLLLNYIPIHLYLLLSLFMYSACIFEEGTHNAFTEVREELGRVGSFLPPCGIQSSNSSHQGWQQTSLFAELSCQVFCILEIWFLS